MKMSAEANYEQQIENLKINNGSGETKSESFFEDNFKAFAKFGDPKSDGRQITLSNSDKWMKQAKVIDGKKITTTDTGIYFKKLKSQKLDIVDYKKFLEDLAKNKKVETEEIKHKMASCGLPGHHGVGAVKPTGTVDRLTDASKYTGTHKQRFDETGKGKGIVGRKDLPDESGYVSGYQNKDTFVGIPGHLPGIRLVAGHTSAAHSAAEIVLLDEADPDQIKIQIKAKNRNTSCRVAN